MNAFNKVIGCKEIKTELIRYCDTLKNTRKYKQLGVNPPQGVLLYGEPGVGKTLMAKCFIEEVGLPAFTIRKEKPNGTFVDYLKEIFKKAEDAAPSIIFLDDLDKFANEDDDHPNAEEYITVQSCIDESRNSSVFVLATANEIRKLPESLIRSGRFDKTIEICVSERDTSEIMNHYLGSKQVAPDIDPTLIASIMQGYSYAALETVINEAGIYAGYEGKSVIEQEDIIKACLRIRYNAPEYADDVLPEVTEVRAIHEAGHAVVSEILDPEKVMLVSICFNTDRSGGLCITKRDYFAHVNDKRSIEKGIIISLAGKAATDIYGIKDTGIRIDLENAYGDIGALIDELCMYGFREFDNCFDSSDSLYRQREILKAQEMEKYYQKARDILIEYKEFLDEMVKQLKKKKILTNRDIFDMEDQLKIFGYASPQYEKRANVISYTF